MTENFFFNRNEFYSLDLKRQIFASKCPGNPKNVNSSTEFCVTSFFFVTRSLWWAKDSPNWLGWWQVGYDKTSPIVVALKSSKKLLFSSLIYFRDSDILRKEKKEFHWPFVFDSGCRWTPQVASVFSTSLYPVSSLYSI